jgi:splicing factor U2AF subunit
VLIPRPSPQGDDHDPPGVGLVFLEYATASAAEKAQLALHGREFGEKPIAASLLDKAAFLVKQPGQQQEQQQVDG